jgi:hypothetical protein
MRMSSSHATRAALLAATAVLTACTVSDTPFTPYPIPMDLDGGMVVVNLGIDDGPPQPAIIDTLSPLTVIDGVALGDHALRNPERVRHDLTIYSVGTVNDAGMPVPPVPQARFGGVSTFDLHPCAGTPDGDGEACTVGFEGAALPVRALLGADLWSRYAIRFSFARRLLSLFPDISGDNRARALLCEAVFPAPFYSGGTLVVSGAQISFIGYRMAMGACLLAETPASAPDAGPPLPTCPASTGSSAALPRRDQALNALFVVSTGLPITLVSESFHARYLAACAQLGVACDTTLGAPEILHIASGPLTVRRTTIMGLTLVSEFHDQRGPCQELYTSAYMLRCGDADLAACCRTESECDAQELRCPCEDQDDERVRFCRAGASIALTRTIPVAVIPDTTPLLQALRDELRPELPELDGILAPGALEPLELDVDYPNNRAITRCDPGHAAACAVLPAVLDRKTRESLRDYCPL